MVSSLLKIRMNLIKGWKTESHFQTINDNKRHGEVIQTAASQFLATRYGSAYVEPKTMLF